MNGLDKLERSIFERMCEDCKQNGLDKSFSYEELGNYFPDAGDRYFAMAVFNLVAHELVDRKSSDAWVVRKEAYADFIQSRNQNFK